MNLVIKTMTCRILCVLFEYDFKRLKRNHFDRKVNYLWIFLQKILSATCSKSHPGVEVAPQTPTLSPSWNHSGVSSEESEI